MYSYYVPLVLCQCVKAGPDPTSPKTFPRAVYHSCDGEQHPSALSWSFGSSEGTLYLGSGVRRRRNRWRPKPIRITCRTAWWPPHESYETEADFVVNGCGSEAGTQGAYRWRTAMAAGPLPTKYSRLQWLP